MLKHLLHSVFFVSTLSHGQLYAQLTMGSDISPEIGLYAGGIRSYSNGSNSSYWLPIYDNYSPYSYQDFDVKSAYSYCVGLKLNLPISEGSHIAIGISQSTNSVWYRLRKESIDQYYYNDKNDTLFDYKITSSSIDLLPEYKILPYAGERFSVFLSGGIGIGFNNKIVRKTKAYPYESEEIPNYEKTQFTQSGSIRVIMHAGLGCNFDLTPYLYLTLAPQYVFYSPSDLSDEYHQARLNIGLNYRL